MRRRFINSKEKYLSIRALEDTTIDVFVAGNGELFVQINDGVWEEAVLNVTIELSAGDVIKYKGSIRESMTSINADFGVKFSISNKVELFGDCTSIFEKRKLFRSALHGAFEGAPIIRVSADFLPATTLEHNCYRNMFSNCTSLITAPELPATTLASYCYREMFSGCSKLNYIKMLATDISANDCLYYWVTGVASSGTFVKNPNATWDVVGVNGVPQGWAVKFDGEEDGGLLEFTVDGVAYQFEDGMTWKEWCDSSYNIAGFIYDWAEVGDGVYTSDYKKYILQNIEETTVIEAGAYTTKKVAWPM